MLITPTKQASSLSGSTKQASSLSGSECVHVQLSMSCPSPVTFPVVEFDGSTAACSYRYVVLVWEMVPVPFCLHQHLSLPARFCCILRGGRGCLVCRQAPFRFSSSLHQPTWAHQVCSVTSFVPTSRVCSLLMQTQNISSSTHHIKYLDACMEY
jgi:hypothetical protein